MKEKIKFRCVDTVTENGVIKQYKLQSIQGPSQYLSADVLHRLMSNNKIDVINLKITEDGKIVSKEENGEAEQSGLEAYMKQYYPEVPNTVMKAADMVSVILSKMNKLKPQVKFYRNCFQYDARNNNFRYLHNLPCGFDDHLLIFIEMKGDCKTFSLSLGSSFAGYEYSGSTNIIYSNEESEFSNALSAYSDVVRNFMFYEDIYLEDMEMFVKTIRKLTSFANNATPEEIVPQALIYYADKTGIKDRLMRYVTNQAMEMTSTRNQIEMLEALTNRFTQLPEDAFLGKNGPYKKKYDMNDILGYIIVLGKGSVKRLDITNMRKFIASGGDEFTSFE